MATEQSSSEIESPFLNEAEETLSTWNAIAQKYKDCFLDKTMYNHTYDSFLERMLHHSPSDGSISVLDIGCGPGILGKYLLAEMEQRGKQERLKLTGIDAAVNMIDIAKQLFPQCKWIAMNTHNLVKELLLHDEQPPYQGIFVGFCIPYLAAEDVRSLLLDCYALLPPQGTFYISFVPGDYEKSEYKTNGAGQRVYFRYFEEQQVHAWMTAAGFGDIASMNVEFPRPNNQIEIHKILLATKLSCD